MSRYAGILDIRRFRPLHARLGHPRQRYAYLDEYLDGLEAFGGLLERYYAAACINLRDMGSVTVTLVRSRCLLGFKEAECLRRDVMLIRTIVSKVNVWTRAVFEGHRHASLLRTSTRGVPPAP
jgi:hypothetical protein